MSIWRETRRDKIKTVAAETRAARWSADSARRTHRQQVGEALAAQPGGLELQGDALIAACMMERRRSTRRAGRERGQRQPVIGCPPSPDPGGPALWLDEPSHPEEDQISPARSIRGRAGRGRSQGRRQDVVRTSQSTVSSVCGCLTRQGGTAVTFDLTLNDEARLRLKSSWVFVEGVK